MRTTILYQRSALLILGLDENNKYSEEDVKAAFRKKAKLLHPDAGGSSEKFRELHAAYGALRDEINKSSSSNLQENKDGSPFYNNAHSYWSTNNNYNYNAESGPGSAFARGSSSFNNSSFYSDNINNNNYYYNNNTSSSSRDFGSEWEEKKYPNNSTRDFYRPYTSNPFSHGFTKEEIKEAEYQRRILITRYLLKHIFLWGGLLYLIYVYLRENRIAQAIKARENNYKDNKYWEKQEEDAKRGLTPKLHSHWMDVQNEAFIQAWNKSIEDRRKKQNNNFNSSFMYLGRPVAVTFQGRPFTATGVRGSRSNEVKNCETFINDIHCEIDDIEEE